MSVGEAGGAAGSWVTGFTAAACLVVFVFALFRGEKEITRGDTLSLIGAGVATLLWWLTQDPLLAVVLITLIDALGFYPTFRKSWFKPQEETLSTYWISSLKFAIALFALGEFTLVTALYPASLVIMNGGFAAMVAVRRKQPAGR